MKYKVWDKHRKKMFYHIITIKFDRKGEPCLVVALKKNKRILSGEIYEEDKVYINEFELLRYIGLKDENNVDICDRDFVKTEGRIFEIKWNQLHCGWGLFSGGGMQKEIIADWINDDGKTPQQWECKGFEVIGNIHENKDLIK